MRLLGLVYSESMRSITRSGRHVAAEAWPGVASSANVGQYSHGHSSFTRLLVCLEHWVDGSHGVASACTLKCPRVLEVKERTKLSYNDHNLVHA